MRMLDLIFNRLIREGYTWPVIDRVLGTEWQWRVRLNCGVPDGPVIEARHVMLIQAALLAAGIADTESAKEALQKAIFANEQRIGALN